MGAVSRENAPENSSPPISTVEQRQLLENLRTGATKLTAKTYRLLSAQGINIVPVSTIQVIDARQGGRASQRLFQYSPSSPNKDMALREQGLQYTQNLVQHNAAMILNQKFGTNYALGAGPVKTVVAPRTIGKYGGRASNSVSRKEAADKMGMTLDQLAAHVRGLPSGKTRIVQGGRVKTVYTGTPYPGSESRKTEYRELQSRLPSGDYNKATGASWSADRKERKEEKKTFGKMGTWEGLPLVQSQISKSFKEGDRSKALEVARKHLQHDPEYIQQLERQVANEDRVEVEFRLIRNAVEKQDPFEILRLQGTINQLIKEGRLNRAKAEGLKTWAISHPDVQWKNQPVGVFDVPTKGDSFGKLFNSRREGKNLFKDLFRKAKEKKLQEGLPADFYTFAPVRTGLAPAERIKAEKAIERTTKKAIKDAGEGADAALERFTDSYPWVSRTAMGLINTPMDGARWFTEGVESGFTGTASAIGKGAVQPTIRLINPDYVHKDFRYDLEPLHRFADTLHLRHPGHILYDTQHAVGTSLANAGIGEEPKYNSKVRDAYGNVSGTIGGIGLTFGGIRALTPILFSSALLASKKASDVPENMLHAAQFVGGIKGLQILGRALSARRLARLGQEGVKFWKPIHNVIGKGSDLAVPASFMYDSAFGPNPVIAMTMDPREVEETRKNSVWRQSLLGNRAGAMDAYTQNMIGLGKSLPIFPYVERGAKWAFDPVVKYTNKTNRIVDIFSKAKEKGYTRDWIKDRLKEEHIYLESDAVRRLRGLAEKNEIDYSKLKAIKEGAKNPAQVERFVKAVEKELSSQVGRIGSSTLSLLKKNLIPEVGDLDSPTLSEWNVAGLLNKLHIGEPRIKSLARIPERMAKEWQEKGWLNPEDAAKIKMREGTHVPTIGEVFLQENLGWKVKPGKGLEHVTKGQFDKGIGRLQKKYNNASTILERANLLSKIAALNAMYKFRLPILTNQAIQAPIQAVGFGKEPIWTFDIGAHMASAGTPFYRNKGRVWVETPSGLRVILPEQQLQNLHIAGRPKDLQKLGPIRDFLKQRDPHLEKEAGEWADQVMDQFYSGRGLLKGLGMNERGTVDVSIRLPRAKNIKKRPFNPERVPMGVKLEVIRRLSELEKMKKLSPGESKDLIYQVSEGGKGSADVVKEIVKLESGRVKTTRKLKSLLGTFKGKKWEYDEKRHGDMTEQREAWEYETDAWGRTYPRIEHIPRVPKEVTGFSDFFNSRILPGLTKADKERIRKEYNRKEYFTWEDAAGAKDVETIVKKLPFFKDIAAEHNLPVKTVVNALKRVPHDFHSLETADPQFEPVSTSAALRVGASRFMDILKDRGSINDIAKLVREIRDRSRGSVTLPIGTTNFRHPEWRSKQWATWEGTAAHENTHALHFMLGLMNMPKRGSLKHEIMELVGPSAGNMIAELNPKKRYWMDPRFHYAVPTETAAHRVQGRVETRQLGYDRIKPQLEKMRKVDKDKGQWDKWYFRDVPGHFVESIRKFGLKKTLKNMESKWEPKLSGALKAQAKEGMKRLKEYDWEKNLSDTEWWNEYGFPKDYLTLRQLPLMSPKEAKAFRERAWNSPNIGTAIETTPQAVRTLSEVFRRDPVWVIEKLKDVSISDMWNKPGGASGMYDGTTREISLKDTLPNKRVPSVSVHEAAHALHHIINPRDFLQLPQRSSELREYFQRPAEVVARRAEFEFARQFGKGPKRRGPLPKVREPSGRKNYEMVQRYLTEGKGYYPGGLARARSGYPGEKDSYPEIGYPTANYGTKPFGYPTGGYTFTPIPVPGPYLPPLIPPDEGYPPGTPPGDYPPEVPPFDIPPGIPPTRYPGKYTTWTGGDRGPPGYPPRKKEDYGQITQIGQASGYSPVLMYGDYKQFVNEVFATKEEALERGKQLVDETAMTKTVAIKNPNRPEHRMRDYGRDYKFYENRKGQTVEKSIYQNDSRREKGVRNMLDEMYWRWLYGY